MRISIFTLGFSRFLNGENVSKIVIVTRPCLGGKQNGVVLSNLMFKFKKF